MEISTEFYYHALEKERESFSWDLWKELYPYMKSDTFVSFEDFKKSMFTTKQKFTQKTREEIEQEFNDLLKR